jgi:hypothetical protein
MPASSPAPASAGVRRWIPRRFVVADRSMEPTLVDGQGLIAVATRHARPGELRCFQHPQRPGFWMVKRVTDVHDDGTMIVLSDNRSATVADSRTFGPIPIIGSYRVVVRFPRRVM